MTKQCIFYDVSRRLLTDRLNLVREGTRAVEDGERIGGVK